jgi:hypothetical protein
VASDTVVTLTARDTGSATPVTATVTVKPGTVGNDVTITPSSTQAAACGTAVCSGGDAEVRVTISQGGTPLGGRSVRFEVVSGDFRIVTSAPGAAAESLAVSGTTNSDESGVARMRIRVLPNATAQTALLQITDLGSGAYRQTSFTIAAGSNVPLSAQPDKIAFVGEFDSQCKSGVDAQVIVVGGRPPYSVSQPGTFGVNPPTVSTSGGRFTVTALGQCSTGTSIAVVDSAGSTVTVTVTNSLGTVTQTQQFLVTPQAATLSSCGGNATVVATGGTGTYYAASGDSAVKAAVSGSTITISRPAGTASEPSPAPVSIQQDVWVTDGKDRLPVNVTLKESAAGKCPP